MTITERHREAESRFRRLLADATLPEPDDVEYEPESVVFYWHAPKVAVFVDLPAQPPRHSSRLQLMSTVTLSATLPSTV